MADKPHICNGDDCLVRKAVEAAFDKEKSNRFHALVDLEFLGKITDAEKLELVELDVYQDGIRSAFFNALFDEKYPTFETYSAAVLELALEKNVKARRSLIFLYKDRVDPWDAVEEWKQNWSDLENNNS